MAVCYDSQVRISGFVVNNVLLYGDSKSSLFYLQNVTANISNISLSGCEITNFNFLSSFASTTFISNVFFSKNSLLNQNPDYFSNSFLYLTGNSTISKLSFLENSGTNFFFLFSDADISANVSDMTCTNNALTGVSQIVALSKSENFFFCSGICKFRIEFLQEQCAYNIGSLQHLFK